MPDRRIKRKKQNRINLKRRDTVAEQLLKDLQEAIDHSKVVSAVSFIRHETGEVSVITSDGDSVEMIGLIEVGKQFVYKGRWS